MQWGDSILHHEKNKQKHDGVGDVQWEWFCILTQNSTEYKQGCITEHIKHLKTILIHKGCQSKPISRYIVCLSIRDTT